MSKELKYRIQNKDKTIAFVGTDKPSWFNLEQARDLVDRDKGQIIIEHDGINILWETF